MADPQFSAALTRELEAFTAGTGDLRHLLQRIERELQSHPDRLEPIRRALEHRHRNHGLSAADYGRLSRHIDQLERARETLITDSTPLRCAEAGAATGASAEAEAAGAGPASKVPPDSASEEANHAVAIGTVLNDRFVLEQEIGRGGMGIVYRAKDLRKQEAMDRHPHVAVKVLGSRLHSKPDAFIALQRECKKAQHLAHPNIATVYDFDRDGDTVYMTMELLEGESVESLLKRMQPGFLDFEAAWPIIRDMAEGLGYAHGQGIVHSDFKPANAFVLAGGKVKVLDFGIAKAVVPPGQTAAEATVFTPAWEALTPAYASCEMFDRAPPDPRDDIYGLACVAYELLAGHHPFDKLPANQARRQQRAPLPIAGLKRKQNLALSRALRFSRSQRTATTSEFMQQLRGDSGVSRSAVALWIGSLVLVVLALGAASYFLLNPPPTRPSPGGSAAILTDGETLARIDRILAMADLHRQVGRLAEPPGSNAYDAYQAVLQLQATNSRALAGLDHIAAHYLDQARQLFQQGELQAARRDVEKGLELFPDNVELQRLRQQIASQMASMDTN